MIKTFICLCHVEVTTIIFGKLDSVIVCHGYGESSYYILSMSCSLSEIMCKIISQSDTLVTLDNN